MVDVRARFGECQGTAATVAAAVLGETTFGRLRRSGCNCRVADTRSNLSRRSGQTHSQVGAAAGATLAPGAAPLSPGAPSARGSTPRSTTGAQWRGAGPEEATHALTWWPNAGNCKDPHLARSRECPERKQARQSAAGWRSPPLPRREQRAKPPPPEVTAPPLGWRRGEAGG